MKYQTIIFTAFFFPMFIFYFNFKHLNELKNVGLVEKEALMKLEQKLAEKDKLILLQKTRIEELENSNATTEGEFSKRCNSKE